MVVKKYNNYKYCIIYKTINKINGKIYIGQHKTNNLNDGYIGNGIYNQNDARINAYFHSAVNKYGYENFSREILEFCLPCKHYINEAEKFYIKKYNSTNKNIGYNISHGGGGCFGVIPSDETRLKLSLVHLGKKKGEVHSKNISIGQRNIAPNVFAYTVNGEFIGEFNSIQDTSEILNLNRNAVANAFNRSIRYKTFVFYREKTFFTKYVANQTSIRRKIYVFNDKLEIIHISNSMIELSVEYNINYNALSSACNRFTFKNGLYFVKETKLDKFRKLKNI